MVSEGTFREDLYFRLRVFPVQVPPLRERREDISALAIYFMQQHATHLNKEVTKLTPPALAALEIYEWPGNVRELAHMVERAVILCPGPEIRAEDISLGMAPAEGEAGDEIVTLEEMERRHIRQVLEQIGWVIGGHRGAAALLGVPRSTLQSRMKKLGIERT